MDVEKIIAFIEEAGRLKDIQRLAFTEEGKRESVAEHSWRLALLACIVADEYPELDKERVLTMCLIHDMGEIYDGDIPANELVDKKQKDLAEFVAVKKVFSLLPPAKTNRLMEIWQEYNEGKSPEAQLVKALDKAETIISHNQGLNPTDFDYDFNLEYGRKFFSDEKLKELRKTLDSATQTNMAEQEKENNNNSQGDRT